MVIYVPAVSGALFYSLGDIPIEYRFWRTECPVFTDISLVSYGVYVSGSHDFKPEEYLFKEYNRIYLDSGGFQISERRLSIDANDVIAWQSRFIERAGAGEYRPIVLDYPISTKSSVRITREEAIRRAIKTARNTETMISRLGDLQRTKLYGVYHYHIEIVDPRDWFDITVKPYINDVDGFCVGAKPLKDMPYVLPIALKFLSENDVRNIHVFMGSGRKVMSLLPLFDRMFKEMTFDSSTFAVSGMGAEIISPNLDRIEVGRRAVRIGASFNGLRCICPACSRFLNSDISDFTNITPSRRKIVTYLHNLYHIIQYLNFRKILFRVKREKYIENLAKKIPVTNDHETNVNYYYTIIEGSFDDVFRLIRKYRYSSPFGLRRWL